MKIKKGIRKKIGNKTYTSFIEDMPPFIQRDRQLERIESAQERERNVLQRDRYPIPFGSLAHLNPKLLTLA